MLDCDVCKNGRPEYTIRYNPGLNCLEFRQADDEQLFAAVLLGRKVMVSVLDGTFQSLKIYLASFGYGHERYDLTFPRIEFLHLTGDHFLAAQALGVFMNLQNLQILTSHATCVFGGGQRRRDLR